MRDLRSDDRVLVIDPTPEVPLETWARQVAEGLLVVTAQGDDVYEMRRRLRDHNNVMITGSEPDGVVPWRDGFFTVVVAPSRTSVREQELRRVLSADGRLDQT